MCMFGISNWNSFPKFCRINMVPQYNMHLCAYHSLPKSCLIQKYNLACELGVSVFSYVVYNCLEPVVLQEKYGDNKSVPPFKTAQFLDVHAALCRACSSFRSSPHLPEAKWNKEEKGHSGVGYLHHATRDLNCPCGTSYPVPKLLPYMSNSHKVRAPGTSSGREAFQKCTDPSPQTLNLMGAIQEDKWSHLLAYLWKRQNLDTSADPSLWSPHHLLSWMLMEEAALSFILQKMSNWFPWQLILKGRRVQAFSTSVCLPAKLSIPRGEHLRLRCKLSLVFAHAPEFRWVCCGQIWINLVKAITMHGFGFIKWMTGAFVCILELISAFCHAYMVLFQAGAWPLTQAPSSTFAIPQELEKSVQMVG